VEFFMGLSFVKTAIRHRFPKQWVAYTIWKRGYIEPEIAFLSNIISRNRVSIDVGANIGVYTRALAKLTPHVYAFEPSKELASLLRRIVPANVTVFESAASDHSGRGVLKIPVEDGRRSIGLATLESSADLVRYETEDVKLVRLDDVIRHDVGFIKIDVEGHELAVLKGSTSLIYRSRPVLLVECEERHNRGGTSKLFEFLKEFDYVGKFVSEGYFYDISKFNAIKDQTHGVSKPYIYNFFFLPSGNAA
jgi:FkbM family methyltransferase